MRYGAFGFLFIALFLFLLALSVQQWLTHHALCAFLALLLSACFSVFSWQMFDKWNRLF